MQGLQNFGEFEYKKASEDLPSIWQEGSTRLIDYGGETNSPIALFVPSLINRAYILDLSEERSMLKFLASQNIRCLLLDWGDPRQGEKNYTLEDYIKRLGRAIEAVGKPVALVGYCMGGLMAMATALRDNKNVKALSLLATPWDFHSKDVDRLPLNEATVQFFSHLWESAETVPGMAVYQLFYLMNPWLVHDKYARFAEMDPKSEKARAFFEREFWLNDDVALTAEVAKECFVDWAVYNTPMEGKWQVEGNTVKPEEVAQPTLIAIPKADRIVPPLSASPLSVMIPNAETIYSPSGHIGMIVGSTAENSLWTPLANWLQKL